MSATLISILASISAIAATVLAFIFIVPEKKGARMSGFGKLLHDILNFKFLIIEKILQALYIFTTAFVICYGFFYLFYVQKTFLGTVWLGYLGLLYIILGPILVRIVYELMMMFILLVKNTISINNKLKNQNEKEGGDDIFATPTFKRERPAAPVAPVAPAAPVAPVAPAAPVAPTAPVAPAGKVCPVCGAVVTGNFCTKCGAKVE